MTNKEKVTEWTFTINHETKELQFSLSVNWLGDSRQETEEAKHGIVDFINNMGEKSGT